MIMDIRHQHVVTKKTTLETRKLQIEVAEMEKDQPAKPSSKSMFTYYSLLVSMFLNTVPILLALFLNVPFPPRSVGTIIIAAMNFCTVMFGGFIFIAGKEIRRSDSDTKHEIVSIMLEASYFEKDKLLEH